MPGGTKKKVLGGVVGELIRFIDTDTTTQISLYDASKCAWRGTFPNHLANASPKRAGASGAGTDAQRQTKLSQEVNWHDLSVSDTTIHDKSCTRVGDSGIGKISRSRHHDPQQHLP